MLRAGVRLGDAVLEVSLTVGNRVGSTVFSAGDCGTQADNNIMNISSKIPHLVTRSLLRFKSIRTSPGLIMNSAIFAPHLD